ncbi:hypothetical protein ACVBEQ_16665 [Nakamurella sp. GG22]
MRGGQAGGGSAHRRRNTAYLHPARFRPGRGGELGPGWEYYLDRLVAAETGGDVAGIDFDRDYYPAMVEYYRGQLAG